jgi:hypothetical protein
MLTCGTGRSVGHFAVPKHASAAWDSGQTPKCLQPSICSLWMYSPSLSLASGSPSALTYSVRLAGGSGAITAIVERNSIFMQPPRWRRLDPTIQAHSRAGKGD